MEVAWLPKEQKMKKLLWLGIIPILSSACAADNSIDRSETTVENEQQEARVLMSSITSAEGDVLLEAYLTEFDDSEVAEPLLKMILPRDLDDNIVFGLEIELGNGMFEHTVDSSCRLKNGAQSNFLDCGWFGKAAMNMIVTNRTDDEITLETRLPDLAEVVETLGKKLGEESKPLKASSVWLWEEGFFGQGFGQNCVLELPEDHEFCDEQCTNDGYASGSALDVAYNMFGGCAGVMCNCICAGSPGCDEGDSRGVGYAQVGKGIF
jgi:hypothetical protein